MEKYCLCDSESEERLVDSLIFLNSTLSCNIFGLVKLCLSLWDFSTDCPCWHIQRASVEFILWGFGQVDFHCRILSGFVFNHRHFVSSFLFIKYGLLGLCEIDKIDCLSLFLDRIVNSGENQTVWSIALGLRAILGFFSVL